ncbi:MAG: ABC transporter substrate-binding protein [Opitutales bacterium]
MDIWMYLKRTLKNLLPACIAFSLTMHAWGLEKVRYQLDWLPGGDKAPIYVCIEEGFAAEEGLEISIEPGKGSTQALSKLATGVADIGSSGMGAFFTAKANEDIPATAVMSIFNQGPHAFYALKKHGLTNMQKVKGLRIATSPFTSSNMYLPLVLEDAGLKETDVKLLKVDPSTLGPMLVTGRVDGIIAWLTDVSRYTQLAERAGKQIDILPWADEGLMMYSATLVASDKFLKERPEAAKGFLRAFHKSLEFCKSHPERAAQAVIKQVPELSIEDVTGPLQDALRLIHNETTLTDGLGAMEPKRVAATWQRVAQAQNLAIESFDPESAVDRSFKPSITQ